MKKRYFIAILFLSLFLTFCTKRSDINDGVKISEQDFELLMNQLEGNGCYWGYRGSAMSRMDILLSPSSTTTYDCQDFASLALGSISEANNIERAVPVLIHHLRYKSDKPIEDNDFFPLRWRAMQALGRIKDPRAIDALIEVIHHSRQCLSTKPSSLCLSTREYDENRQLAALETLTEIGVSRPDIISLLMSGLKDKLPNFRSRSAIALANFKIYSSIDSIITVLNQDPDESTRDDAAWALGIFGPKAAKAVPDLIQAARKSKKIEKSVFSSLAKIGTPEAVDALKEFIKSSDSKRSNEAKKALSLFEESKK
jgi:HEAT repeat protein